MSVTRKRIAQVCAAAAGAAVLMPWYTNAGLSGTGSVRGIEAGVGRLLLAVCIVTIALVQIGWRPAWIGAGFAGAMAVREVIDPSGIGSPDPGSGLWVAIIASAVAVVLLVWDMFSGVSEGGAGGDMGEPPKRGLSGPLGRRRQ